MPSVRFVDAFCVTSMSSSIAICPIVLITAADSCCRRCCSCWEVVCICWRRDCSLTLSSSMVLADSVMLAWSSSIVGGVVMSMRVSWDYMDIKVTRCYAYKCVHSKPDRPRCSLQTCVQISRSRSYRFLCVLCLECRVCSTRDTLLT